MNNHFSLSTFICLTVILTCFMPANALIQATTYDYDDGLNLQASQHRTVQKINSSHALRETERLSGSERSRTIGVRTCDSSSMTSAARGLPPTTTTAIQPFFPSNQGFLGTPTRQFLMKGERINRFGGTDVSRFFAPVGTPAVARSLPPGVAQQPLRTFEVLKPFEVQAGTVAPAFGQFGLGTQFRTPVTLDVLLRREILREVP